MTFFLKILCVFLSKIWALQIWGFWPTGPSRFDPSRDSVSIALVYVDFRQFPGPFVAVLLFSKFSDFAMLRKYPKRFLVTKLLGNGPFQMKIGANDSELTCATFFKKSCSGQKIKNNTIFNIIFSKSSFHQFSKVCSEYVLWANPLLCCFPKSLVFNMLCDIF